MEHDEKQMRFGLGAGLNVSHWLSQTPVDDAVRSSFMTAADFKCIAAMGFRHVRIPVDEVHLYDEAMNRDPVGFRLLENGIEQAFENHLKVIVDLHVVRSHHFNSENAKPNYLFTDPCAQERFVNIWLDLQRFLKRYSEKGLAYELLNEVVAENPRDWNGLIAKTHAALRKAEPSRYLVIGSDMWQSVNTFQYLEVPADPYCILSFHYYDPLIVTHYRAPWTEFKHYTGPVAYPGEVLGDAAFGRELARIEKNADRLNSLCGYWDKARIEKDILQAVQIAKDRNLELYCGEFGVFPNFVDKEIRLNWYRDVISILRAHGISYAHWNYKTDFPVVDKSFHPNEVEKILINGK
jgi:endoglucanase